MFRWYHVEFPKGNEKHSQSAHYLIVVLCPALKLQDILSLASNGPYCAYDDGALVFRVNSLGPPLSKFRLGFSPVGQSLLSEIPRVESPSFKFGRDEPVDKGGIVIKEHVLDFLLTRNHSKEADNHVPRYGISLSAPRTQRSKDYMATLYVRRSGRLSNQKKQNQGDDEKEQIDLTTEDWGGAGD
ncbi:hypothetical protein Tco_1206421, partial [Tanacetum coccineum]